MDDRSAKPFEAVLSVFVYAPIGFLLDARELMPQLTTRGRQQVELLKVAAKFAVAKGKLDAEQKLRSVRRPPTPVEPAPAAAPSDESPLPAAASEPAARKAPARKAPNRKASARSTASKAPKKTTAPTSPPIASYDTLSATQILPRLATLDSRNLDVVYEYERSHRGRRTILGRVEQLRAATG